MKKILGTTLAAALLIPGPANAEILKNLKVNGQLDVQANSARNVTDFHTRDAANNDRVGDTLTRVMADAKWDLLDDVHATVTLRKNDRTWGQTVGGNGGAAQTTNNAAGSQAVGAGGIQAATYIDQANFSIDKLFGHVDATVGRQWYGDQGDLILYYGTKDNYGLTTQAIDAFRAEMSNDWMAFSGLAGTVIGNTLGSGKNNVHLRGADILWKSLPVKLHTYMWNALSQAGGTLGADAGKNDNLYVYGLKMRGEAMGGWLSVDLAQNAGECRLAAGPGGCSAVTSANYSGRAFLLDLGYNAEMSGVGALTPWLNFGWGSGRGDSLSATNDQFVGINTDYRPGIINRHFDGTVLGLTDSGATSVNTIGLSNRVVWGAGLNVTPAAWEKLTAGVQMWDYRLQRNTSNNAVTTNSRGNKHIGTEFGITADWKHSENVKASAGYARFHTGGFIKEKNKTAGVGDSPATFVFGDISVKF